jgi:glyoxylase-like metal-dependent hydrolase (beta-lactamase superfamily II)
VRDTPQAPQWDMLPGALDTAMLAFTRRPGVLRCNTYVLCTPHHALVVDPGADPAQTRTVAAMVSGLLRDAPRQATLCLTHCHLDHCASMDVLHGALPEATVLCHSEGAEALRRADPDLTLAGLTALRVPALPDVLPLFQGPGPAGVPRAMDTPGGGLRSLSIPIGPRDALQVYHTPGHSPDSVCYRVGGALFAGDLPFAAGPGLVRLPGWNGAQLAASLEKILWLLEHCNVSTVLPGHGRALERGEARRVMADILADLRGRGAIDTPPPGGALPGALLASCAALLAEAALPAPAKADPEATLPAALPSPEAMPGLHRRAARLAAALDRTLDAAAPGTGGTDPAAHAVRRARRRLGDLLCALHGFRFADHAGPAEANQTVAGLLAELSASGRFAEVALSFAHAASAPVARMDAEALADLVETALEAYKDAGAREARVTVRTEGPCVVVALCAAPGGPELPETLAAYLRLSMDAYGGAFEAAPGRCTFAMPRAGEDR